jgi:hypothetical protein
MSEGSGVKWELHGIGRAAAFLGLSNVPLLGRRGPAGVRPTLFGVL